MEVGMAMVPNEVFAPVPYIRGPTQNGTAFDKVLSTVCTRKMRGVKHPIPEDLKDEKYFERRKRNNMAAKKSRDARKMRGNQIAIGATLMERENNILKAQLATLKEEAMALRTLLLCKRQSKKSKA